jgi:hypothetical protein
MPAPGTDARAARAVEIFAAILASGETDPYLLYAQLHELGDAATFEPGLVVAFSHTAVRAGERGEAVRRGGIMLRGFDRLPVTVG